MWTWLGINDDPKTRAQVNKPEIEGEPDRGPEAPGEVRQASEEKKNVNLKKDLADVASNLGKYVFTFADAATKTASKLKDTVDDKLEKTIVGDFQRENDKFVQEKEARRIGDAVPPWVGYHEESSMKRQILALSSDERNFLRDPPSGVDFQFTMSHSMPVAIAALKEDEDLQKMRFNLVPKRVKEERFWRNYFYRVSLIKQSTQLSSLADQELRQSPKTSSSESLNTKDKPENSINPAADLTPVDLAESPTASEFVSDAFQENEGLSEEERKQMLGVTDDKNNSNGENGSSALSEDWEKEIQEELESFELVDGDKKEDYDKWEQEIEDMLEQEQDGGKTTT